MENKEEQLYDQENVKVQINSDNQEKFSQQSGYSNQPSYNNQVNYNNQPNYNNQVNYNNQPNYQMQGNWNSGSYPNGLPPIDPVTDVFYYLFFAMMTVDFIISFFRIGMMRSRIEEFTPYSAHYSQSLFSVGLSIVSLLFALAGFVFLILDIYKISKAKYPIVGLVLFGILLRPGYFVWRAYILKRRKLVPIIFTVFMGLLTIINIVIAFQTAFSMMMVYMNSIR